MNLDMSTDLLRYAAFTRDGEGGNPAGVVLDARELTDDQMLSIARRVGYSETAFVLPGTHDPRRAGLRYFSPEAEVAFCGHATVATAVALAERDGPGRLQFTTSAGAVTVDTRHTADGARTATLTSPPAHSSPIAPEVLRRLLAALRWTPEDLHPDFPVHVAFAGNHHPVVAVRDEGTLAALDYDFEGMRVLMGEHGWTTVHAFWPQDPVTFQVRNPFPPGGVTEDPATGAAAAAFGGYLRLVKGLEGHHELTLYQGHHMGSPSRLVVELDGSTASVRVTGTATRLPAAASADSHVALTGPAGRRGFEG